MRTIMIAAALLAIPAGSAVAEPYNLNCISDHDGSSVIVLIVRDSWSRFVAPAIEVVLDGNPGNTAPLEVKT